MRTAFTSLSAVLIVFLIFGSCVLGKLESIIVLGKWTREVDFPGTPRSKPFNFSIGNRVYIGMGYGLTDVGPKYHSDCYSFDGVTWIQIADFPGTLRERAVAFSINGKGYVGTGYNRELLDPEMKDFWEYNPDTDEWKQLGDFDGAARYNAVGFADGQNGYVGTGYDGIFYNDFWKYDPSTDHWALLQGAPSAGRESASVISIDNKFYLLSGINSNSYLNDIWEFDPTVNEWRDATPPATDANYYRFKEAVRRYDAVGFSLDGRGYIATGVAGSGLTSIYQFDVTAGTWTKMASFTRSPRGGAVGFVIDGRPFVGMGVNGSIYFDDVMQFSPYQ